MRYNPDTDRFVDVDAIAAQCSGRVLDLRIPQVDLQAEVHPEPSETDRAVVDITYSLWNTSRTLSKLTLSEVGEGSFNAMVQDVEDVVRELRKLCTRV